MQAQPLFCDYGGNYLLAGGVLCLLIVYWFCSKLLLCILDEADGVTAG